MIARARSDYSEIGRAVFNSVKFAFFGKFANLFGALFDKRVTLYRVARHHYVFCGFFFIRFIRNVYAFPCLDNGLSVSDTGADAKKNGGVELFAELKCFFCKFKTFGRIRGFKHGHLCAYRIMTGILLILRRVHSGVVRHAYDHTAAHARIRKREQRVCRNVETDVFHGAGTADTADRRTETDFRRNLFVRSPFAVNIIVF